MTKRGGPKCGGKLHGRDGTCTLPAGWGTDHKGWGRCKLHLGSTPNVAKAAERERVEHEVRALLVQRGLEPIEDPLTELQMLAAEMRAWKDAVGELVNALGPSLRYEGIGGEQLRAEVALWERAADRYERILVDMARLNLDERLVKIGEGTAALVNRVIRGTLVALGVTVTDEVVRLEVARQMRLVNEDGRPQPPRLALTAERVT